MRNWRAVTSQTDHGSGLDWDPFPGQSFGVNGALVWIFLDELRELDLDRPIEIERPQLVEEDPDESAVDPERLPGEGIPIAPGPGIGLARHRPPVSHASPRGRALRTRAL